MVLERNTLHVPDVLADPEFKQLDWQKVGRQRTVLGVPLLREGTLVGVMILRERRSSRSRKSRSSWSAPLPTKR